MSKGKQFISELKLYSDYLKWNDEESRYETWEEACDSVMNTHRLRYGDRVEGYIQEVIQSYYNKEFLPSQRSLQFREELIIKNNAKLYNCCVTYAYSPDVFHKSLWVLLCGTGLGVSMKRKFTSQLPPAYKRGDRIKEHIIEDSIEGWSQAMKALVSSFIKHPSLDESYFGYQVKFDYSPIRPKGAHISGGFRAPGPDGLRQSMERIEKLITEYIADEKVCYLPQIILYDIFMHLSDAVLSGGVRRSAMNIIMDEDDDELIGAKRGNWYETHRWRARSNNSVGLLRGEFTKEDFTSLVSINQGDSDIGFVFMSHEDDMFNPCFEIQFNYYEQIKDYNETVFQFCNLTEANASACTYDTVDNFSEEKFYSICRNAAIIGTLQAGYTNFPYLGKQTEDIVKGEALLGVSITGWMMRPELFDERILKRGAQIVKDTNREVAKVIEINPSARTTTVKPSGNASVVLKTSSGIHPEHSPKYFRIMQLNKDSETAKWLEKNKPEMLEESSWSSSNTDYVVYSPCENPPGTLYKSDMQGVKHLELIRMVQKFWVEEGKNQELCYRPTTCHNVSNTVIIDDIDEITDYIFEHQWDLSAVSFISEFGDKDYKQAPNTSVLDTLQLIERYGDGVVFMSGLIVDGLRHFDDDLWKATEQLKDKSLQIVGTRDQILLKKDWVRRARKFAENYFKGDLNKTIYCMKDVHLWHKWNVISKGFKVVDFTEILKEPHYVDINTLASVACQGGACEI